MNLNFTYKPFLALLFISGFMLVSGYIQVASTQTAAAAVHVANVQGNGSAEIASVKTQTVEAVVVELSNGSTKLLICPL